MAMTKLMSMMLMVLGFADNSRSFYLLSLRFIIAHSMAYKLRMIDPAFIDKLAQIHRFFCTSTAVESLSLPAKWGCLTEFIIIES